MIRRLRRLYGEVRLLGWRATRKRIVFELLRRSGIAAMTKRPVSLSVDRYLATSGLPRAPDEYLAQWRHDRRPLGLGEPGEIRAFMRRVLGDDERARVAEQARQRHAGQFRLFHHDSFDYPRELLWYRDPESGAVWPKRHSSRLLLELEQYGDIKIVWEIGRFAWVFDLVRAWLMDGEERHIELLFELIDDFAAQNPMYIGPHWTSEQEVAIRALMLAFVIETLADSPLLDGARLQSLHALVALHGRYLADELDYARDGIRNNHLIYGAAGLYAVATCLPWHEDSEGWAGEAREILLEAAGEQWYRDGGYVQPSNNYHRAAWHGMLWVHRIAESRGDSGLVEAVAANAAASLGLFLAQIDRGSGRLPNWGPNDGALVGAWTSCDYSDYRPVVQSLAFLGGLPLPFGPGAWDEEGVWFFGADFLEADRGASPPPIAQSFPEQGIHVLRPSDATFALLRCGSVTSRYGQQADQMHVDIFRNGTNTAIDAGSFNYNKSRRAHDWFRGTSGHNTVIIDEQDQMIPHRKFKYLRWTRAKAEACSLPGSDCAFVGVHDGYTRLDGDWVHARLLAFAGGRWVVVDRVWPRGTVERASRIRLHWLLAPGDLEPGRDSVTITRGAGRSTMTFSSDNEGMQLTASCGQDDEQAFDGWSSRYYNFKEPVHALNYVGDASGETVLVTVESDGAVEVDVSAAERTVAIDGRPVSIAPLFEQAADMLAGLGR